MSAGTRTLQVDGPVDAATLQQLLDDAGIDATVTDPARWYLHIDNRHGTGLVSDADPAALLGEVANHHMGDFRLLWEGEILDAIRRGLRLEPEDVPVSERSSDADRRRAAAAAALVHHLGCEEANTELDSIIRGECPLPAIEVADALGEWLADDDRYLYALAWVHAETLMVRTMTDDVHMDVWYSADGSAPAVGWGGDRVKVLAQAALDSM